MTVLPTERAVLAAPPDSPAAPSADSHPRLERRRQRRRHRIEAALLILSLPAAVAVTLLMLLTASGGSVLPAEEAASTPVVRVEGALPVGAADTLVGDGVQLDVTGATAERERTEVIYFSRSDRVRAEELAKTIGAEVVVLGTSPSPGAAFVIRVGEDLAA